MSNTNKNLSNNQAILKKNFVSNVSFSKLLSSQFWLEVWFGFGILIPTKFSRYRQSLEFAISFKT